MMSVRTAIPGFKTAWLRVLLLAAVVMAAFAHRPLVSVPEAFQLAQYVMPDGTVPDICSGEETDDRQSKHDHAFCDFCLIAGASHPAEPAVEVSSQTLPLVLAVLVPATTAPPVVAVELATASKRGPPTRFS